MYSKQHFFHMLLKLPLPIIISLFAINCSPEPTELIVDNQMTDGSFRTDVFTTTVTDEYTFSTEPYSMYAIVWDNSNEGSGTKTASVKVTAKDNTGNYLKDQWSGLDINSLSAGYTTLRLVATGNSFSQYSIDVECNECNGTYGIQVISMSQPITLGAAPTVGSITERTPSPDSNLMTYSLPITSSVLYTVRIDDSGDGTGSYLQDVFHFVTFSDPLNINLLDTGALSSYTTPDTFSIGSYTFPDSISISTIDAVFIWVMLTTDSILQPGYSIQVF